MPERVSINFFGSLRHYHVTIAVRLYVDPVPLAVPTQNQAREQKDDRKGHPKEAAPHISKGAGQIVYFWASNHCEKGIRALDIVTVIS